MANEKDIGEKFLEECNDVFADIINVLLFDGRQVVKPEELEPSLLRSQFKADGKLHEQERDVAKFWRRGKIRIALYGTENQTAPDADMPLRAIGYDGAVYKEQVIQHRRAERTHEAWMPVYPAVTLVLYFGDTRWNKPKDSAGMYGP